MKRLLSDPCVYLRKHGSEFAILPLSRDDSLIAHNSPFLIHEIVSKMSSKFPITDLGEPKRILGMRVTRKNGKIFLDQEAYIHECLERFNMSNADIKKTPAQPNLYQQESTEKDTTVNAPYQSLVGALNWIATCTRPDIVAAVSSLCRFMQNPRAEHWTAAKRVLAYLKGTREMKLCYRASENQDSNLHGFSDANCGGDINTRKSTTGFVFLLTSGAIACRSTLQSSVACSTMEAEYMALSETAREA